EFKATLPQRQDSHPAELKADASTATNTCDNEYRGLESHRFICYSCMMQTGDDTPGPVFTLRSRLDSGWPWQQRPSCCITNTESSQDLENEGSEMRSSASNATWASISAAAGLK